MAQAEGGSVGRWSLILGVGQLVGRWSEILSVDQFVGMWVVQTVGGPVG